MYKSIYLSIYSIYSMSIVTLLGAHTLGHVNINQSGYGVPLSNPRNIKDNAFTLTPLTFDRTYYGALLAVVCTV